MIPKRRFSLLTIFLINNRIFSVAALSLLLAVCLSFVVGDSETTGAFSKPNQIHNDMSEITVLNLSLFWSWSLASDHNSASNSSVKSVISSCFLIIFSQNLIKYSFVIFMRSVTPNILKRPASLPLFFNILTIVSIILFACNSNGSWAASTSIYVFNAAASFAAIGSPSIALSSKPSQKFKVSSQISSSASCLRFTLTSSQTASNNSGLAFTSCDFFKTFKTRLLNSGWDNLPDLSSSNIFIIAINRFSLLIIFLISCRTLSTSFVNWLSIFSSSSSSFWSLSPSPERTISLADNDSWSVGCTCFLRFIRFKFFANFFLRGARRLRNLLSDSRKRIRIFFNAVFL